MCELCTCICYLYIQCLNFVLGGLQINSQPNMYVNDCFCNLF